MLNTSHVWVLTTYPTEDASRRLRIDPLVRQLRDGGARVSVDCLLSPWAFANKNAGSRRCIVAVLLVWGLVRRIRVLTRIDASDVVIVHREAFPFCTPWAERMVQRSAGISVLDVDDAIHTAPTHGKDWRRFLRQPNKALEGFAGFDLVLAGSPQMKEVTRRAGAKRTVLAMTAPPDRVFASGLSPTKERVVVWSGSHSTLPSLAAVLDQILRACAENGWELHVLGAENVLKLPSHPCLRVETWTASRELEALSKAMIGVMPLPSDSEWEAGKSSYKALLYMAAGVTPVVTPIGMNEWLARQVSEVVGVPSQDGWATVLSSLMQSDALDERGVACRQWAETHVGGGRVAARIMKQLDELLSARPSAPSPLLNEESRDRDHPPAIAGD